MCTCKYYNLISVAVSILAGIIFTVLALFNLITSLMLGPWLAIALAAFSLLLLTLGATSLLRQDRAFNTCICSKGSRLLWAAVALLAVSVFSILFALTNLLIVLTLVFLIAALFVYTLINLFCLLACLARSGCSDCDSSCRE